MRKYAAGTVFNLFAVPCEISWVSRTVLPLVQGTIAEQAVKILQPLMARKILALLILKKTV